MEEEIKETGRRVHQGHNLARLRRASGKKQSVLAQEACMSQQTWSRYERKQAIEDDVLTRMAKALEVPVEVIKEMEEDPLTLIAENQFNDNSTNTGTAGNVVVEGDQIINNPVETILEFQKKNEELRKQNEELHERLLKAEQEKNAYLEKLIKKYEEG